MNNTVYSYLGLNHKSLNIEGLIVLYITALPGVTRRGNWE